MQSKLDAYFDANKMYNFEGHRGVRNMEKVMKEVCGYGEAWGGTLRNFFTDNPGAIQAVMEWIVEQRVPEWNENLTELVGEEDFEEADIDE